MKTLFKKQQLVLLFALTFTFSSYAQWKSINGNGKMTTETRTTSDYDVIKCAGNMDYILVSGTEGNITLEGEENLLEHIITEVKDGKLIVKTEKGKNLKPSNNKTVKITIPFKDISKVSLAGSGDLWNEDTIATDNLKVSLAGAGDVVLDLNASSVEGSLAGSGDLTLKGKTNDFKVRLAGSGDIDASNLQADNTDVSVTGSGDAEVVSNQTLKARVTGSGDIDYIGNPTKEDTKVTGSGSISN